MVRGSGSKVLRRSLVLALLVVAALACLGCQKPEPEHPEATCMTAHECTELRNKLINKYYKCDGRGCDKYQKQAQAALDRAGELRKQEDDRRRKASDQEYERNQATKEELEAEVKKRCDTSASACEQAVADLESQCERCRAAGKRDEPDCDKVCSVKGRSIGFVKEARTREQREEEKAKRADFEQKRNEENARVEARNAEARKNALDKKYAVPALSILLCERQEELAKLKKDLARERAIAQKGGVIDLTAQREIAEGMQGNEERIREIRGQLSRGYSAQPVSCASVQSTRDCMEGRGECSEEDEKRAGVLRYAPEVLEDPKAAKTAR